MLLAATAFQLRYYDYILLLLLMAAVDDMPRRR